MERYNRYSEIFWLLVTIVTAVLVIYLCIVEGFEKTKWTFVVPMLTAAVYIMRRSIRKRFERNKAEAAKQKR